MADASTLPKPEKRKPLTRIQFATLLLDQSGRCGCGCGKKLKPDQIIDEHVQALDFLGSNDLSNRSLWDRDCSKAKTAKDLAAAAKGKRLRLEKGQQKRRAESGSRLKSPGFKSRPDGVPSALSKSSPNYRKQKFNTRKA